MLFNCLFYNVKGSSDAVSAFTVSGLHVLNLSGSVKLFEIMDVNNL